MGPTFGVFLFDTSVRPVSFPRVARRNAPLEQGLDAATPVAVALFATHNRASCQQVRASLAFLAPRAARRAFAAVALAVAGAAEAAAQWVPERVSAEWGPRAAEAGF